MSRPDKDQEQRTSDTLSMERIADLLREEVPIRASWRGQLLRGVAQLPTPVAPTERTERRWRLRPVTAIAAALACGLVGAGIAVAILGHGRRALAPKTDLTTMTATMPLPGDPAANIARREEDQQVRFVFVAPYATRVSLVGDFNGWNASTMPMRRSADGRAWLLEVPLPPGRHVYAFVVDGDVTADPAAPRAGDDFGVPSSVVLVTGQRT
jgi:hypothetical protein